MNNIDAPTAVAEILAIVSRDLAELCAGACEDGHHVESGASVATSTLKAQ